MRRCSLAASPCTAGEFPAKIPDSYSETLVVPGGYGAALAASPSTACDVIKALRRNLPCPVTCKVRLQDTEHKTHDLLKALEGAGAQAITVHCRDAKQSPSCGASHSHLMAFSSALTVPIILNGDIWDVATAQQAIASSGVASGGVMLARGALRSSCAFSRIASARAEGALWSGGGGWGKERAVTAGEQDSRYDEDGGDDEIGDRHEDLEGVDGAGVNGACEGDVRESPEGDGGRERNSGVRSGGGDDDDDDDDDDGGLRGYIRRCIDVGTHPANWQYTIQAMIHEAQQAPKGTPTLGAWGDAQRSPGELSEIMDALSSFRALGLEGANRIANLLGEGRYLDEVVKVRGDEECRWIHQVASHHYDPLFFKSPLVYASFSGGGGDGVEERGVGLKRGRGSGGRDYRAILLEKCEEAHGCRFQVLEVFVWH